MIINSNTNFDNTQCFLMPNVVADNLIQESCPVYNTVYLYTACQFHKGNLNISNQYIADVLKINIMDVVNAFLFYSSKGVLKIHNFKSVDDTDFDVEFLSADEVTVKTGVEFKPSYKRDEINRVLSDNPRISRMYKLVGQILGKNLSTADIELLYSFYDFYALPVEVIIVLVEYFVSKGKRSLKSMEKEVAKWASSGVDSVPKAKNYIKKREEFLSFAYKVRSIVGISDRKLSKKELEFINTWQYTYKSTEKDIKDAFEKTVNQTGKLSFNYMNAILESELTKKAQNTAKIKKTTKKSARYNFDEIEKIAFDNINKKNSGGAL